MRAVSVAGQRIAVVDHPEPAPGRGEILVEVRAAGINGADIMQLRGLYPPPAGTSPDIPGLEMAGEVLGLGDGVTRFRVGDRVMALLPGAAQAERVVVHERIAMPVPDGLDWAAAGGFAEVFTTAHDALVAQAGLRPGERLLVHGAAGGVGMAAVQIGAAIGARVVGSVRNPENREAVAGLGAEAVDPADVGALAPFDVVLELVGAPNFPANLDTLAIAGRIVVIGVGAGARIELDLHQLMQRRGRIMASMLRSRTLEEKAIAARRVEAEVLPMVTSGRLRVLIAATYPLEKAADAYARFQAGAKLGKIVLNLP